MFQFFVQLFADAFAFGFNACRFFHDHIGIHHNEPAVRVIGKSLIAGLGDESFNGIIVEAYIQYGFHHARHGFPCAGTNRQQQWIIHIAKALAHDLLHLADGFLHLIFQDLWIGFLMLIIISAKVRGDGKAGGYR